MKKSLFLAALAGLLWVLPALAAEIEYETVKSDTVALFAADSSVVMDVEGKSRMWLVFIETPLRGTDMNGECDTTYIKKLADGKLLAGSSYAFVKLDSVCTAFVDSVNAIIKASTIGIAVQAREVMPVWAITDASYSNRNLSPSTYADSTYVPWYPGYSLTDSVSVNRYPVANASAGSSEIQAVIHPVGGAWASRRSVRVDLVDAKSGSPFRAKFASFRWRLDSGAGPIRLRVVLGYEK